MTAIFNVIPGVKDLLKWKSPNDDDMADKLNRRYTTLLLIIFSVIVSLKQYVGEPINCWVPAHFTGNHEEYTNSYCWIRNTYYLPLDENIPKEYESEKRRMITYYQWTPLILLLQSFMFCIPSMFWHAMVSHSGIDISNVITAGTTFTETQLAEIREKTLRFMTLQMDRFLSAKWPAHRPLSTDDDTATHTGCTHPRCTYPRQLTGSPAYLTASYLVTKVLYLANVVGQLFLLEAFLGNDFHLYGIDVIRSAVAGEDWMASPRFPRTSMCDLKVRRLGNIHRYTVQCVLPINQFNEKIFLFIWFWLVAVSAITTFSLLRWIVRDAVRHYRSAYIKKHLKIASKINRDSDRKISARFVDEYLRQDGVFIMRLVGQNTNAITVTEFVCSLWDNYGKKSLIGGAKIDS